jgi:hypothetical protein
MKSGLGARFRLFDSRVTVICAATIASRRVSQFWATSEKK